MKILVTGGTGFIGRHFLPQLLADGHEVVLLDLVPPEGPGLWNEAVFVQGDVRDPEAVSSSMAGCDAVLHLAAAHHDFGLSRETYFSVNEGGTRTICKVMEERGVADLCLFSTVAVYGPTGSHDESEPPNPQTPYGESKLAAEEAHQQQQGH